jgi:hypothetical protein
VTAIDPRNGNLRDDELVWCQLVRLSPGTANAFTEMDRACFAETSLHLWPALPIGGYRDWATQVDMRLHPKNYGLNPDSTASIARAGESTHGLGQAVDIGSVAPMSNLLKYGPDGQKRREWLLANASRFGFKRIFGEVDPNHFQHDGYTATGYSIRPATTDTKTLPVPKEWDEMATKDEIKTAVQEVLGNRPGTVIVSYADPEDEQRNGIVIASLAGHWHKLTGEEKAQVYDAFPVAFAGLPTIVPGNDRQYDLVKSVYTNNT